MSGQPQPQTSLLGALFLGGIPFLMGAATVYFTSGVTFRCDSPAPGQVTCADRLRTRASFRSAPAEPEDRAR